MAWFIITGRIHGADEDSLEVIEAPDGVFARAHFFERLVEGTSWKLRGKREGCRDCVAASCTVHARCYVNAVVYCGLMEPQIVNLPPLPPPLMSYPEGAWLVDPKGGAEAFELQPLEAERLSLAPSKLATPDGRPGLEPTEESLDAEGLREAVETTREWAKHENA